MGADELPLPGGSLAARRRRGSAMDLVARSPFHAAGAVGAVLVVAGIVFPAPSPLPCGGAGGGWADIARLDPDDPRAVDRSHKKAVHLTGRLQAVSLNDDEFQFMREGVVLRRLVEMFQWDRDPSASDGFSRRWATDVIDSRGFPQGKLNPLVLPFSNHTQVSLPARLLGEGMLRIDQALVPMLSFYEREPVRNEDIVRLPSDLHGTFRVAEGFFFRGRDMHYPSVGDVRVSFYLVRAETVSLVAKLRGRNLETCNVDRGSVGRMPRPRARGRRGGRASGAGGSGGGGGGGKGGGAASSTQARARKRKVGRKFMDKVGSLADVLRGSWGNDAAEADSHPQVFLQNTNNELG